MAKTKTKRPRKAEKIDSPTADLISTMGGSTVFGYEQQDGSVAYAMYTELSFDEIYGAYMAQHGMPEGCRINKFAKDVPTFFSEFTAINEDSIWRVLYKLDGSVHCKRNTGADVIVKFV